MQYLQLDSLEVTLSNFYIQQALNQKLDKKKTYLKTAYDVCTKFVRLHKVLSLAAMLIVHMQNIFVTFACTIISSEELSPSPRYSTLKVDFFNAG